MGEGFEGKERVLEDEIARLRTALSEAEARSRSQVKAAEEASQRMVTAVEERVSELEVALSRKTKEAKEAAAKVLDAEASSNETMRVLREEYGEALESLRAAHADEVRESRQRERSCRIELERVRKDLERKKDSDDTTVAGDREEAAEEASATERAEEGAVHRAAVGDGDVIALRDHIAYLENRCSKLQKQLNARPIACQYRPGEGPDSIGTASGASALPWEPIVRANLGPRASALVVQAYGVPNRAMRRFTELLLRKDLRLWLFYLHVMVLYMIVASASSAASSGAGQKVLGTNLEQHSHTPG